jgi:hypothetical protein
VRAYEAVYGTVADEIAYVVRPYDIDDAAALHLLKKFESNSEDMIDWSIWYESTTKRHHCRIAKDMLMVGSATDLSLARAICLALVAAKESH